MPRLYVANLTQQIQTFIYRVPETTGVRQQQIEIGGQIEISGSEQMSMPQIDSIIEQHARYGLIDVNAIDRTKPFAGMCYSVGKPIAPNKIRYGLEHNTDVLIECGKGLRRESAVAMNSIVEDQLQRKVGHMDMEISEVAPQGSDQLFGDETFRVEREGSDAPKRPRRRAGAR